MRLPPTIELIISCIQLQCLPNYFRDVRKVSLGEDEGLRIPFFLYPQSLFFS
jgi:hypothetical protein